jgi:hypothetical protein
MVAPWSDAQYCRDSLKESSHTRGLFMLGCDEHRHADLLSPTIPPLDGDSVKLVAVKKVAAAVLRLTAICTIAAQTVVRWH